LHAKIFASELGLQGDHSLLRTGEAIMPNHYHLQVGTPRANLSRAIQWLNVGYSIWFNRKYNRVGPLFQGQDWETLHTGHGNGALGAALYLARKHSDNTLRELGELAGGMQYPAVTMAIRRLAKRLEDNKALARKVKRVEKMLFVLLRPDPYRQPPTLIADN
jgi:hypothetical protein